MTQHTLAPSEMLPTEGKETRRQQVVARLLGAQSFETINYRQLMQDGVLVQLHVRRCRFTTRLLLSDMGIQVEDERIREKLSTWLVLGEKRLLPETYMKALNRIESSARYTLKEHAFRTELGAFVPVTAYLGWREKTEQLRTEYLALRDEILANYRELVHQVLTEYEVIAADIYQRLRSTHPEVVPESQAQFVTSYCNRLADQIPTPEHIRETFSFRFFRVDGLTQLGTRTPPETSTPTDAPPETTAALRQQTEQRARQRAILEHDLRHDAQARVNAMLDSFLTSLVGHLRALTYDAACDVLTTLERRGTTFSPRSTVQLGNLLSQIRTLNFFGDSEIDQMMTRIQQIVEMAPASRNRSLGDIGRTLRAIATTTRAQLLDLEDEPRQARTDLGLPAFPTEQLVRQARAELALAPLDLTALADLSTQTRSPRAEALADPSLWGFVERNSQESAPTRAR